MIKIGFITSPLTSGHAVRGVGFYTKHLLTQLKVLAPEFGLEIIEISGNQQPTTYNPQLIHYPFFDLFHHSLPLFSKVPTIVTIHDVIPLEFPQIYRLGIRAKINLNLQKLALGRIKKIITDSQASKKQIIHSLNQSENKIVPIHLAPNPALHRVLDKSYLKLVSQKYHLPPSFVLFVGDINWNKNLISLAAVCNLSGIPLVLVGKHFLDVEALDTRHPELAHLAEFTRVLKSPHIIRLGFVPDQDLSAVYSLAAIYCQPSFAEGFGLPVLEAFACKTPVVCSNTHSLPEIADDAVLYFDPYKAGDLSVKINTLWHNSRQRKLLASKGTKQVTRFSWEKTARKTIQLYTDVLR